jgi:hypothetical protein
MVMLRSAACCGQCCGEQDHARPGPDPGYAASAAFATVWMKAGDRVRTGDIQLGKLTLYQLSYTREVIGF